MSCPYVPVGRAVPVPELVEASLEGHDVVALLPQLQRAVGTAAAGGIVVVVGGAVVVVVTIVEVVVGWTVVEVDVVPDPGPATSERSLVVQPPVDPQREPRPRRRPAPRQEAATGAGWCGCAGHAPSTLAEPETLHRPASGLAIGARGLRGEGGRGDGLHVGGLEDEHRRGIGGGL